MAEDPLTQSLAANPANQDFYDQYSNYNWATKNYTGDYFSDILLGTNRVNQKRQNYLSLQMMRDQNRYNQFMSNTSYQRAIKDMQAAGINPALAVYNGGAPSPISASANLQAPDDWGTTLGKKTVDLIKKVAMLALGVKGLPFLAKGLGASAAGSAALSPFAVYNPLSLPYKNPAMLGFKGFRSLPPLKRGGKGTVIDLGLIN